MRLHNIRFPFLSNVSLSRRFISDSFRKRVPTIRNIGISAHIDSGKTTVTERILYYTGRISSIHEVRGSTGVGATMDSMELERERGITIRSAATYCKWRDISINLIDTPGHVDFTIEVERALRVLDGAVLILCAVSGVQSQTLTVDRQMRRYKVPRICFINKMDRDGADPTRAVRMANERLNLNAAFLQLPIGLAHEFEGVVDLLRRKALYFDSARGETVREDEVPSYMTDEVETARRELIGRLADVDSVMEEHFLEETEPNEEELIASIRKATINNRFTPVLVGSAYRNKGVQPLLDAVRDFLPNPTECINVGNRLKRTTDEEGGPIWVKGDEVVLQTDDDAPLLGMIFKLERTPEGGGEMINFLRIYQGKLRKGDQLINVRTRKPFTPTKLVRMHSNRAENVDIITCGEICAIVGDVGASSGDSVMKLHGSGRDNSLACENIFVPPRVLSMSLNCKDQLEERYALDRLTSFMREDPTFAVQRNPETEQLVLEGMGELQIDIYVERLKREFGLTTTTGKPMVNYREVVTRRTEFDYVHKRQSGGQGQWAHIKGVIEPLSIDWATEGGNKNKVILKAPNGEIKEQLQKSFAKAFDMKILRKGQIVRAPVWGVKVTLTGGAMHEVDSTDIAFRSATQLMWDEYLPKAHPTLVEPWMHVEITAPKEYASDVNGEFCSREGLVLDSSTDGADAILQGEAALDTMFGFIGVLRKLTKGQGDFSMHFKEYRPMPVHKAQPIVDDRNEQLHRPTFDLSEAL